MLRSGPLAAALLDRLSRAAAEGRPCSVLPPLHSLDLRPRHLRTAILASTLRTESNAASTGHRPCPASDAQLLRPSCRARMRGSMGRAERAGISFAPWASWGRLFGLRLISLYASLRGAAGREDPNTFSGAASSAQPVLEGRADEDQKVLRHDNCGSWIHFHTDIGSAPWAKPS